MKYCFGVDIGGTTVKMGLFEATGTILEKWEIKTHTEEEGKAILPDVAASLKEKKAEHDLADADIIGVGVGVPAPVTEEGIVFGSANLGWKYKEVKKELEELTGLDVEVGNDANVAALGEQWQGGGKGYQNIVMFTLGTGVGGGIIQNGQIAQFDRPEEILKRPANAYVEEFVGKNRLWGNPAYIHAEDIMKKAVIHISKNRTVLQALQIMRHNTVDSLLVTSGREHRLEGIVWLKNLQEVKDYSASLEEYVTQDYISVYADTSLQEIIDTVDYDASGIIPVVNHENELLGGLTKSGLLATLSKRYRRDSTEGAEE